MYATITFSLPGHLKYLLLPKIFAANLKNENISNLKAKDWKKLLQIQKLFFATIAIEFNFYR